MENEEFVMEETPEKEVVEEVPEVVEAEEKEVVYSDKMLRFCRV